MSQLNNEIKLNEKINKGFKKLQSEQNNLLSDNNLITNLSYISKQNKNKKEIKNILEKKIKSLTFYYSENENNIKYNEYFLNANFIPKNIEIKIINYFTINVSWITENNNLISIVEIRKENGEFKNIYKGNNTNCKITNLEININYEIRICNSIDNLICQWSELKKIKTCDFDSIILKNTKKENEFIHKLIEWSGYNKMELIYRGTRDGMNSSAFHQKCDNKGETITLYKNDKGNIFGGFATLPWSNKGSYKNAPNSFIH